MAATAQEILSKVDLFNSVAFPLRDKIMDLFVKAEAVDVNSPDAKATLNSITTDLDVIRSDFNISAAPPANEAIEDFNNASPSVQKETKDQVFGMNKITDFMINNRDLIRSLVKEKLAKVDQKQQQPQEAPGSANAAPGTQTTANANPTTSGSGQPSPASQATPSKGTNAVNDDKAAGNSPSQNQKPPQGQGQDKKPVPGGAGPTTPNNNAQQNKPGKRLFNPLGEYPSYTYQITLYMITPDAYDAFIKSGRKDINAIRTATPANSSPAEVQNNGAYIIVQSGGIQNDALRANGFELDYYIDDLKIVTATSGKDTMTATNVTDISFKIVEPYGFSFISNLKRAANQLAQATKSLNLDKQYNPTRQFFMLGIRFQGLDGNGRPITSKESNAGLNERVTPSDSGIYERFYDILITNISFKLDGKATTYNVQARSVAPQTAMGTERGICDTGCTLQANTVGQFLQQFQTFLNDYNATQAGLTGTLANTFEFGFIGSEEDIKAIQDATLVSPADLDKLTWGGSNAKTTQESNAAVAENATPKAAIRTFVVEKGEPIAQAVQRLISQSSYLEKALIEVQKNTLQPVEEDKASALTPSSSKFVSWYNMSVETTSFKFDPKVARFACNTKYVIQTYQTPVIQNAYTQLGVPYYGPHKRYSYYFTGQNTEVIDYTQNLDNTYFNVALLLPEGDQSSAAKGGEASIPVVPGKVQAAPKSGKYPLGAEAISAYMTDLYDPKAYADAKLTIMGDPDYLMPDQSSSINDVYNRFYNSDGFTINANGGQVFVEIDFKEARDYGWRRTGVDTTGAITGTELTNQGLLTINESIQFWRYPPKIKEVVQGVSYMVRSITSMFSGGTFRQQLDLNINTFPGVAEEEDASTTAPTSPQQAQSPVGTPQVKPVLPSPVSNDTWGRTFSADEDKDAPWAKDKQSRDGLIEGLNRELAANLQNPRLTERGRRQIIRAFEQRRQNIFRRFPNG